MGVVEKVTKTFLIDPPNLADAMSHSSQQRLESLIDSVLADGAPMSLVELINLLARPHACARYFGE